MKVAWIGMGRVGTRMALRVLHAGYDLTGHARTVGKYAEIAAAGGRLEPSLAAVVSDAEIVCVNVYSEAQLRDAMFDGGALAAMRSGSILVVHSTIEPAILGELARSRTDIAVLDAPFSGTDEDADAGKITLMVGGDAAALAIAKPVLSTYADFIVHIGPPGTGIMLKLINNVLFGANILLASDALGILTSQGVDREVAIQAMARSSSGSFALDRLRGPNTPDEIVKAVWPYMAKDVAAARTAASDMGFDLGRLGAATMPYLNDPSLG
ncbi:MAG: beta-hydroxyacid dehydrogenase, 3-hydroxyisobutyrate dehydrogenase [Sphingomonadales bacterium]|jgi:3-hydroxyisobutyrate dehydrogenase-like beta-hydroxyacid dehydrogenase|nr:beta-hydroxyacid dehydrogenase, 3-hydroxyisobutyrate dehydrogenase [Sphingomonadales bacterium]